MIYSRLLFFLFFPLSIFASSLSGHYAQFFVTSLQQGHFSESLQTLNEWEAFEPEQTTKITGMKAAVHLSMGDLEIGIKLMEQFIRNLSDKELSDPMMHFVLGLYHRVFPIRTELINIKEIVFLCNHEQPTGVKLRYWFGVGQILAGILAAPFSGGTSTALLCA